MKKPQWFVFSSEAFLTSLEIKEIRKLSVCL